jgi:hypothetical protein
MVYATGLQSRYSPVEKPYAAVFLCKLLILCMQWLNVIFYIGMEQSMYKAYHTVPPCEMLKLMMWTNTTIASVHEKLKILREAGKIGNYAAEKV